MSKTTWKLALTVLFVAAALAGVSALRGEKAGDEGNSPSGKPAADSGDLKTQVTSILDHRCSQCHKVSRLMSRVDLKAGLKNKLYRIIARGHNAKGKNGACTAEEVKVVGAWLESLSKPASQPASAPAPNP